MARIARLPNVVGSMIGRKVVGGKMTSALGITVFVASKVKPGKLSARQRIPESLRVEGQEVLLDVLSVPPLQRQSVFEPESCITNDMNENGTLSCLCRSRFGIFGMGCAHALDGQDGTIATPTTVRLWSDSLDNWVQIGVSQFGVQALGSGVPGDFGFLDAAVFDVRHPELLAAAAELPSIAPRRPMPGMTVYGIGAIEGARTGHVLGVEKVLYDLRSDVVIEVEAPGTYRGDSGMLWRSAEGVPIAIHAYGAPNGANGSRFTGAMLASRAARYLNVELLAPLG
jgi:hypothetical protein